ncbi:mucoidy inhibitor MuiA family protein [Micromonospora echinospora]|uniref:mucoidy inhibitor MuiA family protein n=1 Tax=Micromonospora echinospora TaxID=1877 RepID=UPI003A84741B
MKAENVDAPIVAVTVYADRARVTRHGTVPLAAGEHRLRIGPLPLGLRRDSLRVGGRGPATVLGVDLVTRHQPRSTDEQAQDLERRRRELTEELAALDDADTVEAQRTEFLTLLSQRAGGTYARALASGDAAPADVAAFADSVAGQLAAGHERQRELVRRRTDVSESLAAVDRHLSDVRAKRAPDRLFAEVTVLVTDEATTAGPATDGAAARGSATPAPATTVVDLELELTYVVDGARWQPSYDLRLVDEVVTLTWFGLVSQETGEDWPECRLELSTARPSVTATVPELSPWYLDRVRPLPPPMPMSAPAGGALPKPVPPAGAFGTAGTARSSAPRSAPVRQSVAEVEQGIAAATYRPARPVAVPADGTAHRATVAVMDLPATLDHVTAPVREPVAHLRATVRNTSTHTLLPGPAAIFHGADFVGSTRLRAWAPGRRPSWRSAWTTGCGWSGS